MKTVYDRTVPRKVILLEAGASGWYLYWEYGRPCGPWYVPVRLVRYNGGAAKTWELIYCPEGGEYSDLYPNEGLDALVRDNPRRVKWVLEVLDKIGFPTDWKGVDTGFPPGLWS